MTDNLRQTIEEIASSFADFPAHPYDPLPPNRNRLGRPPTPLDLSDPRVRSDLARHFPAKVAQSFADGSLTPERLNELEVDLAQFRRAEDGDRMLPGEYMGDPRLPHIPMPFAPRDEHRPDRLPGSPSHALYRQAIDDIDRRNLTNGLAQRMGTQRQLDAIHAREDAQPPTLRESVEAAASLFPAASPSTSGSSDSSSSDPGSPSSR